jgi:hypothetical protein
LIPARTEGPAFIAARLFARSAEYGKYRRQSTNGDVMRNPIAGVAVVLGIVLVVLTAVYWMEPAGSLPAFLPGYEAGSPHVHFKHGIGTLILALALFAFAWFQTGPRRA